MVARSERLEGKDTNFRSRKPPIQTDRSLCVVIDAHHVRREKRELPTIQKLTEQILVEGEKMKINTQVLLSLQRNNDPDAEAIIDEVRKGNKDKVNGVITEGKYKAGYYTRGLQEGARRVGKKGLVVEMDAGGTHDPRQLPRFVDALGTYDAALATRFAKGGTHGYRLQRQLLSTGVTALSNVFLGTRLIDRDGKTSWMSDASSGYQGFRAQVVNDLFSTYPDTEWYTLQPDSALHMIQTELRAYLTQLALERKYSIGEVPIDYGKEIEGKGKKLPITYISQNLRGFVEVWKRMGEVKKRIKQTSAPK